MASECVKVIVRCRPMNAREYDLECKSCMNIITNIGQVQIKNPHDEKAPPKTFNFDGAFDPNSTTETIYSEIAYPLVEGVTEGYNGTIFAYGQTGCGKSFTMQGITDPPTQRGIIPRAFDHIFETVSVTDATKFLIHASYLEIYNEEIRDLLGKDTKSRLELKEHPERGVYVNGLSMHPVHNVHECERIMDKGWKNRATGSTLMNADSSRSHSIFTINLEMMTKDEDDEEHIRAGKLNLVDLAGSERQAKTGATGDRLKEATKINLSLSALGNVISALVDGKSKHIPYRDSKLTRLLQDSLGGNTKTLMAACISPADNNYEETLSTLRYANRAKNIQNKPKINEDPKDALLRQYQEEIQKLKAMLMGQIPIPEGGFSDLDLSKIDAGSGRETQRSRKGSSARQDLEEEKLRIRQEYDSKLQEMQEQYEEEKVSKAKLEQDMAKLRAFYDDKLNSVDGKLAGLPSTAEEEPEVLAQYEYPEEEDEEDEEVDEEGLTEEEKKQRKAKRDKRKKAMAGAAVGGVAGAVAVKGAKKGKVKETEVKTVTKTKVETKTKYVERADGRRELAEGQGEGAEDEGEVSGRGEGPWERPESVMAGEELPAGPDAGGPEAMKLMSVTSASEAGTIGEESSSVKAGVDGEVFENEVVPSEEGLMAPRSSPTHAPIQEQLRFQQEEALRRLQELEHDMVGGENLGNQEVKERRKKRKRYAEERKRKLAEAVRKMDDDGIMLDIYDDIHDELKAKNHMFEKEKEKVESLEREVIDIQSEFEFERIDYLDTIRKQEKQLKLLQELLDKIHPCLRRDCNYYNLDKIRHECKWDEDEQKWITPKLILDRTSVPVSGTVLPNAMRDRQSPRVPNGDIQASIYDQEEDRFREKLMRKGDNSNKYFQPKRVSQLVQNPEPVNKINMREIKDSYAMKNNALTNGFGGPKPDPVSKELKAARVHGQVMNDEGPLRKPMRLESLAPIAPAAGKKSRKSKREPF